MKTCPLCALDVEDSYLFCPDDGSSLITPALNETASTNSELEEFSPASPVIDSHERGLERPGFRVAAIATVIGLALFVILGLYALVSKNSRRPPARIAQVTTQSESAPQPAPFVQTPKEAQDYKETPHSVAPQVQPERPTERTPNEPVPSSSHIAHGAAVEQPIPKRAAQPTLPQAPLKTSGASTSPMSALPRGNSGGFDARLVRVRARKSPSGFRYDLTFNMQEQAGRAALWQRLLITTRSASGTSHSEAIPFVHRLGATGALTFTISVELNGRSEADWQGRIVCTTLGWDNSGGALQASFGANVTP